MIALTAQTRIWVAREPADFRCGIDGLTKVCRTVLNSDPFSGALFVFRNRRSKSTKILSDNGRGFWLCQKRLSKGRFRWWPEGNQATQRRRQRRSIHPESHSRTSHSEPAQAVGEVM